MRILLTLLAVASLCCGGPTIADDADGMRLRYKFEVGDTVRYHATHSTKLKTVKGRSTEIVQDESDSEQHYRVVKIDEDGIATLELTTDRVKMSAQFGNAKPESYDSTLDEEVSPRFAAIAKTIGKPLARLEVQPNGELVSSKPLLPESLQRRVTKPVTSPTADNDPAKNIFAVFPEKPLTVGDTWRESFKVRVNIDRHLEQTVTLLRVSELSSLKNGLATIKFKTSLITPVHDGGVRVQLLQRTPSGTLVFDVERGQLVSRTVIIDRTEVGVIGSDSLMRAVSLRKEELIPESGEDTVVKR
ncbi:hypothetical protein [Thalassoroseus pseudoceratinae]|uniref:hypothetical protein n=1 Tax=Thalassoroseus pseudoceratinae TaxID=2713176 RepID=UPI0014208EB0|nr:hypothetical protein [Thalassoroseus pseudoceratinae]